MVHVANLNPRRESAIAVKLTQKFQTLGTYPSIYRFESTAQRDQVCNLIPYISPQKLHTPAPLSRGKEIFQIDREGRESKYELAQREMIVLSYL